MENHNHRKCFRTSKLYNPCTLLELMTWVEELMAAARGGLVHMDMPDANSMFKEFMTEWRERTVKHAFRLRPLHFAALLQIYTVCDDDGEIKPSLTEEQAWEFLDDVFDAMQVPFACWPRVMVNTEDRVVCSAGFHCDSDGVLTHWDADWQGFKEIRERLQGSDDGNALGCPNSQLALTPFLQEALRSDVAFQKAYWDANWPKMKEAMLGILADMTTVTGLDYTVLMALVDDFENCDPLLQNLAPFADEMVNLFLARARQADNN